jgi:2-dehydropantoate 2-reductase
MMRIAVMGTGAVGGYFGAKLAAAGHDLALIARGKHLEAMRRRGLRIESPTGNLQIKDAVFASDPTQFGTADLVLFCVKSYDTEAAAETLTPLIGDETVVLSLQNGVDNPEKIARRWGTGRCLPGVVYIGAQVAAPGLVLHSSGGKIVFGASSGPPRTTAEHIEQTLSSAGIPCSISENIEKVQWSKLLWNAPFCAISALARADVKQILESQPLKKLAIGCMAEVQAAALVRGVDLPGALFEDTLAFSVALGAFKPSMLQDLEAGKPLEYEAFNGLVGKILQQAGQAAPVNQCFYALLQQLDRKPREEAARQS